MTGWLRTALALLAILFTQAAPAQQPADSLDSLARDVGRLESLRQVKDLQRLYVHYAQYGLFEEMAGLFGEQGRIEWGDERIEGRAAIAAWLTQRGGGRPGLPPGALNTEFIDEPLVNLSVDGRSAKGRWMGLAFRGDGRGATRIEGGVYENDYLFENGRWTIAALRYFPQYEGDHANGWTNVGNRDLPIVPYHFSVDETGIPIPPAPGTAPGTDQSAADLFRRIAALNDEDGVRNLQHAYGYYVDRRMWDDVLDLFAQDAVLEIGGEIFRGRAGIRQALERMGPAGLAHGDLNERPLFDTLVRVEPGGREAFSRGIELAMTGQADTGEAGWEINVFRNRFAKEGGIWKIREMRIQPVMKADYRTGWGSDLGVEGGAPGMPAFLAPHPVTGRAVQAIGRPMLFEKPLTGAIASEADAGVPDFADLRRRLLRSIAYDATENVSAAYGYYLDDFQWTELSSLFAEKGNKQSPFAGYYMGRDRIMGAANAMWGPAPPMRAGISYHWRTQHVIHVSHDGRSANLRTRLFQPRTSKWSPGSDKPNPNGFNSGMYPNDQTVLENGIWRLWSVTIDEHYFSSPDWKGGWSAAKDPEPGSLATRPSPLLTRYPPDVLLTDLGRREEGFRGGTGETIVWPGILPMWFHYRNPVSGRVPELYWPDCVPCEMLPEASMTRHGYQMPPTGPEVDGKEVR